MQCRKRNRRCVPFGIVITLCILSFYVYYITGIPRLETLKQGRKVNKLQVLNGNKDRNNLELDPYDMAKAKTAGNLTKSQESFVLLGNEERHVLKSNKELDKLGKNDEKIDVTKKEQGSDDLSKKTDIQSSIIISNYHEHRDHQSYGHKNGSLFHETTRKNKNYVKESQLLKFTPNPEGLASIDKYECVTLKCLLKESPICVYNQGEDRFVSVQIRITECWERDLVHSFMGILKTVPNAVVLDLGCNIGVFTITAAVHGFRVVGVDPEESNLNLLTKSLRLGGLSETVTLVRNVVSDKRGVTMLRFEEGNIGGTAINTSQTSEKMFNQTEKNSKAMSIILDDLMVFFDRKPIVIKMDIEGSEYSALLGGKRFLSELDVRYVMIEWFQHRGWNSAKGIIEVMTKLSFVPCSPYDLKLLAIEHHLRWPDNVVWRKL